MFYERTTALIVGAGAVENGWAPIIRALQKYHDFPLTADGANCFLARLIYLLRWWATSNHNLASKELITHKKFLYQIRDSICRELRKAQKNKEISVRKEFETIVDKILIENHRQKFTFITTNWDTVVSDTLSEIIYQDKSTVKPIHLHGSIKNSNTLYLPTEITKEPYRNLDEEQLIGGLHGTTWRSLEDAHRVILYGLSISPLDAELSQTLACGWDNNNLQEIIIIDPYAEPIAHRVNLLLNRKRTIIVRAYKPNNLNDSIDYTVPVIKM